MSPLPCISVIIPSYNKGNLIEYTVKSIINTTYPGPFEIIIIDDHSNDPATKAAYKQLAALHPSISIHESNGKGPANARNQGVAHATGDYIIFLDNDDLISPNFLLETYSFIKDQPENIGYVYGDTIVFGRKFLWRPTPDFSIARLRVFNYIPVTCLYKKTALQATKGMDTSLFAMEDWDLFLSLADKGYFGSKVPSEKKVWLLYRITNNLGVNASARGWVTRIRLRNRILRQHNLMRPTTWLWNTAALVFSIAAPLVELREKRAFYAQDASIKSAIQEIAVPHAAI